MKKDSKLIGELFPKSGAALSEVLSVEQFNDFGADVTELNERLTAQANANAALKADFDAAKLKVTATEAKVTGLETLKATLEEKISAKEKATETLQAEKDKLQAWFDKEQEKGGGLPDGKKKPSAALGTHSASAALSVFGLN